MNDSTSEGLRFQEVAPLPDHRKRHLILVFSLNLSCLVPGTPKDKGKQQYKKNVLFQALPNIAL